jgi:hypothetical protein
MPKGLTVLALHASGRLTLIDERDTDSEQVVPFVGAPGGLIGIAVSSKMRSMIEAFLGQVAPHKPAFTPHVQYFSYNPFGRRRAFLRFISVVLADRLQGHSVAQTGLERQVVALRKNSEVLATDLDKARRMMNAVGYGTGSVAFEMLPGTGAEGPDGDQDTYRYAQSLPVVIQGMRAICLYISEVATKGGELWIAVRRKPDGKIIAKTQIAFNELQLGWQRIAFVAPVMQEFSEGELVLSWRGAGGPVFARTTGQTDRFGDEKLQSLALRIETGLLDPRDVIPVENALGGGLYTVHHLGSDLLQKGEFLLGTANEQLKNQENGWEVIQIDRADGWLQTHPLSDQLSGYYLPSAVGGDAKQISTSVVLDHPKADPCIVMLAIRKSGYASIAGALQVFETIGQSDQMPWRDTQEGVSWDAAPMHPGQRVRLNLLLPEALDAAHDVFLVVKPLFDGPNWFGWCRWQDLRIGYDLGPLTSDDTQRSAEVVASARPLREIHTYVFSDISNRLMFSKGRYIHDQLRKDLGYMPVQFVNDVGAMQLHPMMDDICAVLLEGDLPENAVRLTCDIATGHPAADQFTYILGVIPSDCEDATALIAQLSNRISAGDNIGTEQGASWHAVTTDALQRRVLSLDMESLDQQKRTAFFAVIPGGGGISFGWCRWYSLSIETLPLDVPTVNVLPSNADVSVTSDAGQ